MPPLFDHEKLKVYQASLAFFDWCEPLIGKLKQRDVLRDQLDRARTSIPLNLAEGNGKHTSADRCRFFDIARGSALECAACLDLVERRGAVPAEGVAAGKQQLREIVSMLVGLIRSNSKERLCEQLAEYRVGEGE